MGKQQNKTTGNKGETLAAEHLTRKGYTILERNYRNKWGEIDIIAKINVSMNLPAQAGQYTKASKREQVVVFVEVKTKTSDQYGEPWEMVNHWKVEQIKRMGEMWCMEHKWEGAVRVDVVGVWLGTQEKIEHWESVDI